MPDRILMQFSLVFRSGNWVLNLENLAFPKENEGFHISAFAIPDSVLDVESIHYDAQNALKTLPER